MEENDHKNLILRWFDAVNQGDIPRLNQAADELFAPDFMEHDPSMPDFQPGPVGVKSVVRQVRSRYSQVAAAVHDIITDGDRAAYRFTLTLTDASTGETTHQKLLAITRFANGQIAEEWQLGAPGAW